jgi:N-acetylglutamate synthase-like GNAT family acetyltransferase
MNIRHATAADQKSITRIVQAAQINPMDLDWRRFMVAEDGGKIIGVGQIKEHRDGSRELASIAVISERQRQGIGSQIIRTLLGQAAGRLYLMCREDMGSYYTRFGFSRVDVKEMPSYFKRMHRLTNSFLARKIGMEIIVMRRE